MLCRIKPGQELGLVWKDTQFGAVDDVERKEVLVEETGRTRTGHNRPGIDVVDITHCSRELRIDLGRAQSALFVFG